MTLLNINENKKGGTFGLQENNFAKIQWICDTNKNIVTGTDTLNMLITSK